MRGGVLPVATARIDHMERKPYPKHNIYTTLTKILIEKYLKANRFSGYDKNQKFQAMIYDSSIISILWYIVGYFLIECNKIYHKIFNTYLNFQPFLTQGLELVPHPMVKLVKDPIPAYNERTREYVYQYNQMYIFSPLSEKGTEPNRLMNFYPLFEQLIKAINEGIDQNFKESLLSFVKEIMGWKTKRLNRQEEQLLDTFKNIDMSLELLYRKGLLDKITLLSFSNDLDYTLCKSENSRDKFTYQQVKEIFLGEMSLSNFNLLICSFMEHLFNAKLTGTEIIDSYESDEYVPPSIFDNIPKTTALGAKSIHKSTNKIKKILIKSKSSKAPTASRIKRNPEILNPTYYPRDPYVPVGSIGPDGNIVENRKGRSDSDISDDEF